MRLTYSPNLVTLGFDGITRRVVKQCLSREFHLERTAIRQRAGQRAQYQDVAGVCPVRVYFVNGVTS